MTGADVWACEEAEVILPAGTELTDRELWLAERRKGVGGSDAAAVMGVGKYGKTPFTLWLDKTGRLPELEQTEQMEWGRRFEDAIAERFSDDTGIGQIKAGLMRNRWAVHLLVSVDRLTDDGGGLECKNQAWYMGKEYFGPSGEPIIPVGFYWQLVASIAVTGRSHWWLAANIGGQRLILRRLERADCLADIARLINTVEAFWEEYVYLDVPPEDGQPPAELTTNPDEVIEAVVPAMTRDDIRRWRELRAAAKDIKAELAVIKARIKAELGTARVLTVNRVPQARMQIRKGAGRFDRKRFKKDHPDLEQQYTVGGGGSSSFPVLIGDDEKEEDDD